MRHWVALLWWLAVPAYATDGAKPFESIDITDDTGRQVTLARPAARIITLSPSLAELVFSAGAGDRLVGVSSYTDSPPEAARLPVVASPGRIDFERLILRQPDLVLAWQTGNPARGVARLEKLGLKTFVAEPRTLADLARLARTIGVLAGTQNAAERAAREFETELAALPHAPTHRRVFIEISSTPLMTVNGTHLISDVVAHCGGENVFADARVLTPRIGLEDLIAARPELILTSDTGSVKRRIPVARRVSIDPRLLHHQSFRVLDGARAVCAALAVP